MAANSLQPTVFVKKPDGTTVRVSLAEVKKMQAQKASAPATSKITELMKELEDVKKSDSTATRVHLNQLDAFKNQPAIVKSVANLSKSDKSMGLENEIKQQEDLAAKEEKLLQEIKKEAADRQVAAKPAVASQPAGSTDQAKKIYQILKQARLAKPVAKPVVSAAKGSVATKPIKSGSWSKNDTQSLLTEKLAKLSSDQPLTSQSRENQVEKIVKQLGFTVTPDNQNRLRSIIQLRLKDIRDRELTKGTLLRPILQGGLGLLPSQAEQVLKLTDQITGGPRPLPRRDKQAPAKTGQELMIEPEELPEVYREPPVPAKSTPFNSFKRGRLASESAKQFLSPLRPISATGEPAKDGQMESKELKLKLGSQKSIRPIMRDIVPAVKLTQEMGPIQDIQTMSLLDFRRLSANPVEAASRLKQKFQNLKDESYLLYLDGLKAWRQSPLFNGYMTAVESSLIARKPLSAVTTDKSQIQPAEINALVDMEKVLDI